MEESGDGMNLGCEEEKETCTGKRARSHDSTTAWGSSSSDVGDATGETERTLTKNARRRPAEAQARNAEMGPARMKRLREGKRKEEEEEKLVKQKLEGDPDAAHPQHDPQLPGAPPPGATAQEESTHPNLTRGAGYDTTNNMNLFLTQCCGCSITVRTKEALFDAIIQQITKLEEHGVLDDHQHVQVQGHSVVSVLRLMRNELTDKDPHVSAARTREPVPS